MAKGLDREQILNVTLDLLKDQENIRNVNLREIARCLGCAHTNLYNYYSDLDQIFWAALDLVLQRLETCLTANLNQQPDKKDRIKTFYSRFIDFYLENPGWFRLTWLEKLEGQRSQENINLTNQTVAVFTGTLADLYKDVYGADLPREQVKYILHTVHCYLHGEISIFLSGRGLIKDAAAFKQHVINECLNLNSLMVASLKQGQHASLDRAFFD